MFPSLSELSANPGLIPNALTGMRQAGDNREPLAQYLAVIVEYLYQGVSGAPAGIAEAPLDGQLYGRISQGWGAISGPWHDCTYPAGCSGTLQVRRVGAPADATIELIGQASSVSRWDGTYSFILAYLPTLFWPSTDQFCLVPSSYVAGAPDSISCAWFKPTGEVAIAYIYEKGQNPLIAWFDGITIQV